MTIVVFMIRRVLVPYGICLTGRTLTQILGYGSFFLIKVSSLVISTTHESTLR